MIVKCCRAFTSNYAAPSADEAALVQPSTDGKAIPLAGVNDYAGQILKVTEDTCEVTHVTRAS